MKLKRILCMIFVVLMAVSSTFALSGCGKSKPELSAEIKHYEVNKIG